MSNFSENFRGNSEQKQCPLCYTYLNYVITMRIMLCIEYYAFLAMIVALYWTMLVGLSVCLSVEMSFFSKERLHILLLVW